MPAGTSASDTTLLSNGDVGRQIGRARRPNRFAMPSTPARRRFSDCVVISGYTAEARETIGDGADSLLEVTRAADRAAQLTRQLLGSVFSGPPRRFSCHQSRSADPVGKTAGTPTLASQAYRRDRSACPRRDRPSERARMPSIAALPAGTSDADRSAATNCPEGANVSCEAAATPRSRSHPLLLPAPAYAEDGLPIGNLTDDCRVRASRAHRRLQLRSVRDSTVI